MTKIAVVEDELTMREIMVEKLKSSGFDVVQAEDGLKAVKLIEKETPDLVLLDLMLPDLDGYGVLTKIRNSKSPALAKTPVIILTNLWSKDEIVKTKKLGVSAYIIKAYMTTEEIVDKIKEIIKS